MQRKTLSKHAEMAKAFEYILNHQKPDLRGGKAPDNMIIK